MQLSVARALAGALLPLLLAAGGACGGEEKTPSHDEPSTERGDRPERPRPAQINPFEQEDFEPPSGREGEQLSAEELDAVLAKAEAEVAANRGGLAIRELRRCANKVPASARCDARIGFALLEIKRRRQEAHYYLKEAARNDDPNADAELYAQLGTELGKLGFREEAIVAHGMALKREDTAEHHAALAGTLMGKQETLQQAADELARAFELEPTEYDYVHRRATILGQIQTPEAANEAANLFESYLEHGQFPDEYRKKTAKLRIEELRAMAKVYAERDEAAKKGQRGGKGKNKGADPDQAATDG